MATLTELRPDSDGSVGLNTEHDAGTGAPFFEHMNEDPDSPGTDWVSNDQAEKDTDIYIGLTATDANFSDMVTLAINHSVQHINDGSSNDAIDCYASIVASDESTPYTDEVIIGDEGDTSKATSSDSWTVNAAGLAATKANWDAGFLKLRWDVQKSGSGDNPQLLVFAVEISGTYNTAAAEVTVGVGVVSVVGNAVTVTPGPVSVASGIGIVTVNGVAVAITSPPPPMSVTVGVGVVNVNSPAVTVVPGAVSVVVGAGVVLVNGVAVAVTSAADAVEITVGIGAVAVNSPAITVAPGAVEVTLGVGTVDSSGQTVTVVPGAISVSVNPGVVSVDGQAVSVANLTNVTVNIGLATVAVSGPAVTVTPGGVSVSVGLATVSVVSPAVTVTPGTASIAVGVGVVTVNAPAMTISVANDKIITVGVGVVSVVTYAVALSGGRLPVTTQNLRDTYDSTEPHKKVAAERIINNG